MIPHLSKHILGQPAGEGILLAGVIRGQQPGVALAKLVKGIVSECRFWQTAILGSIHPQDAIKGNLPQRDETLQVWQQIDFSGQPRQAVLDLRGFRLVLGRDAAADGADEHILQCQPIPAVISVRLVGKTYPVQCRVEEVAAGITGEHAPGAVRPVRAGCQAYDHEAGMRVAKPGHRLAPVGLIQVGLALGLGDLLPPGHQAGTLAAGDDLLFEGLQCVGHGSILTEIDPLGDAFFGKGIGRAIEVRFAKDLMSLN